MPFNNNNFIPADFIIHGSNENEHFVDPDRIPSAVSSLLRNAVLEAEVTKRFETDLPKQKAIWEAESNKIREEENKIASDKINDLSLDVDRLRRDNTSLKKEAQLKIEKLSAEKDKERSEALQLNEQENVNKINSMTKLSEQKETIDKRIMKFER